MVCVVPRVVQTSYSTSFPAVEDPISQGGIWLLGATDGLDWSDARTGLADDGTTQIGFGKQALSQGAPPYTDSLAVLKPSFISFPADQTVTATIYTSGSVSGEHECELLLRFSISAHTLYGYEVSIVDGGSAYLVLIGSDLAGNNSGANGVFHVLVGPINTNVNGATGSVFVAKASGAVISLTCNGNSVFSYDTSGDSFRVTSGQPGFGTYTDNSLGTQSANNTYGWKSWAAAP